MPSSTSISRTVPCVGIAAPAALGVAVGWTLSPSPTVIEGTPRGTSEDCITPTPVVTLGSGEGEGFITSAGTVVRDSHGRFWVPQLFDGIKVLGADGTYERMYGRGGRGPGEFLIRQRFRQKADDDPNPPGRGPGHQRSHVTYRRSCASMILG